jgi:hypothetical protein
MHVDAAAGGGGGHQIPRCLSSAQHTDNTIETMERHSICDFVTKLGQALSANNTKFHAGKKNVRNISTEPTSYTLTDLACMQCAVYASTLGDIVVWTKLCYCSLPAITRYHSSSRVCTFCIFVMHTSLCNSFPPPSFRPF